MPSESPCVCLLNKASGDLPRTEVSPAEDLVPAGASKETTDQGMPIYLLRYFVVCEIRT